ncbi:MAG: hypothetical protein ACLQVF_01785 [Isosphaeraceae bacterium]
MQEFPNQEPLNAPTAQPSATHRKPDCRSGARPPKPRRWTTIAISAAVAIGLTWAIGREASRRIDNHNIAISRRPEPPATGFPNQGLTAANNNAVSRRGLISNPEGTAVVYPKELRGLAAPSERFQTDLPLGQLADTLKIDGQAIAKKGSATELDPDAVLFTAITGRLSERAKARSRSERQLQARNGLPVDYTADEWVTQEFPFSLNALKQPTDEQKAILRAIWRSAREMMPEPGEKFRAVGVSRLEIQSRDVDFAPGYLPLEHSSGGAQANEE